MKCLRCQTEMKQYQINKELGIVGTEHKEDMFATNQTSYNPQSAYICNNCGYVEFNIHPYKQDIN